MRIRSIAAVLIAFLAGAGFAGVVLAKKSFDMNLFLGKSPKEAADALLEVAQQQAEKGSWENLAVARIEILGGEREKGLAILDRVTRGKMKEEDWMRVGRIYWEAGDRDKAFETFEKAISTDPEDAENLAEVGARYNLAGDRETAEEYFQRAFREKPDAVWVTVSVAASYLGVEPQ